MKTRLSILFLSVFINLQALGQCRLITLPTPANPSQPNGYKLVFNEEFDYATNNDLWTNSPWRFQPENAPTFPDVWHVHNFSEINNASQATVYKDAANNGYLRLRAEELPQSISNYGPDSQKIDFKSGMIRFRDDFFTSAGYASRLPPSFAGQPTVPATYWGIGYARGIYEIRCKMPRGLSTYQAFWLFAWGTGNEIDMFESDSDYKTGIANNVHDWGMVPHSACQAKSLKTTPGNLADDFHTYTAVWTPTAVTFFFDGRELRTVSLSDNQTLTNQLVSRARCADIILNLSVLSWAKNNFPGYTTWDQYTSGPLAGLRYTDFDIDYIRVYQPTQYAANDLAAVYPSYKTDNGWLRTDFEPVTTTTPDPDRQITSTVGCVSASQLSGQVAYSGTDGVLRRYYPQNGTYQYEKITTPGGFQSYMNVKGDVVLQDDAYWTRMFYKGTDDRVHYFYGTTGAWNHDWAIGHDASGNYLWSTPGVSAQPGALAVVNDHLLFYRGLDNRLHKMEWSYPDGWQHELLALDTTPGISASAQLIDGDVVTNATGQVFYVGADGQIQSYWNSSSGYTHVWLDPTFWNSPASLCSNQYGALSNHPAGLVFRGKNDNLVHTFFWTSASGWQHQPLISSTGAMASTQTIVPVTGKLSADANGRVYYRGVDNKLQFYYPNGSDWTHAWPDGWDYFSPRTITTNKDNFSLGSLDAPLFAQNSDGYMSLFHWAQCENNVCVISMATAEGGPIYRTTNTASAGVVTANHSSAPAVEKLQLYPNPATNQITLSGGSVDPVTVVILDLTGRTVLKQTVSAGERSIGLEQLAAGSYTVKLQQGTVTTHQRLTIAR